MNASQPTPPVHPRRPHIVLALKDRAGRPPLAGMPKVPKLLGPERLPGPVADEDLQAIMAAVPRRLADGILLARLKRFRKSEVFSLAIEQVDFPIRCVCPSAALTKARRCICWRASSPRRTSGRRSTCSPTSAAGPPSLVRDDQA